MKLLRRTNMETIATSVMRRKWHWIGHTLRRDSNNVARQALNNQPKRKEESGTAKEQMKVVHAAEVGKSGLLLRESQSISKEPCALEGTEDALCSLGGLIRDK